MTEKRYHDGGYVGTTEVPPQLFARDCHCGAKRCSTVSSTDREGEPVIVHVTGVPPYVHSAGERMILDMIARNPLPVRQALR